MLSLLTRWSNTPPTDARSYSSQDNYFTHAPFNLTPAGTYRSRITPVEAALYMGLPNILFVYEQHATCVIHMIVDTRVLLVEVQACALAKRYFCKQHCVRLINALSTHSCIVP